MRSKSVWTVTVALAVVALVGTALPAPAQAAAGCEPRAVDLTTADVAALIGSAAEQSFAPPQVTYLASGTKVSEQQFVLYDERGNIIGGGSVTCTGTCTGGVGESCGVTGCDVDGGNCSPCSCTGSCSSACSCKKQSSTKIAPAPGSPSPDPGSGTY